MFADATRSDREPSRVAAFVITSDSRTVDEITAQLGVRPDRSQDRGSIREGSVVRMPARFHSWELREEAMVEMPLQDVVDSLFRRLLPLLGALRKLRSAGCAYRVEIVQWVAADDPHGPGFGIDANAISFLAEIGSDLDVDQYLR